MANHLKQTTSFEEGVFRIFAPFGLATKNTTVFQEVSAFQKYHAFPMLPSNHVTRIGLETVHGEFRSVQFQGSAGWCS